MEEFAWDDYGEKTVYYLFIYNLFYDYYFPINKLSCKHEFDKL